MRYYLEGDWHLLDTCNYRCRYCFVPPERLGSKLKVWASPEQWRSAFDWTGVSWLLHLTGGEPSIYPDFVALCEGLTRRHFISVNSNLTHRSWASFVQRIDPARVSFVNAGLHLEERDRRSGHRIFLEHIGLLADSGFKVLVSMVATPPALERFEEAIGILKPTGLAPIPKLLRGLYEGRQFPAAYTESDKDRFRVWAEVARRFYEPVIARMTERPTVDMLYDDALVDGEPVFTGKMCDAGHRFFRIGKNGDIYRCGPGPRLGNILTGGFYSNVGPAPCDSSYCYYFCKKYSQPAAANADPSPGLQTVAAAVGSALMP